jgi:hypothetical protein
MRWYVWKWWIFAKTHNVNVDAVIDGDGTWYPFYKNIFRLKLRK